MQCEQPRTDDPFHIRAMKREIQLERPRMVTARSRRDRELSVDLAQRPHEWPPLLGRERRCFARRESLEVADDE